MTTTAGVIERLRNRIRAGWDRDPLFIDPAIAPGLTPRQTASLSAAVEETAQSGIPVFVAVTPPIWSGYSDQWDGFAADLAVTTFELTSADQAIVLFAEAEGAARSLPYLVDSDGPRLPPNVDVLQRSASDDFLPVELAVPFQLRVLLALATGQPPPPVPVFDPVDPGQVAATDYIGVMGLRRDNPDMLVFGVTGLAAFGLTAWVLSRREKYAWRTTLTTSPELVRRHDLTAAAERALDPLPQPQDTGVQGWALHERGQRVQEAIALIIAAQPGWAEHADHSHRQAIYALTRTDGWVRATLNDQSSTPTEPPRFCYFFPAHDPDVEPTSWTQSGTTLSINACSRCREDLRSEHDPVSLMVPRNPRAPQSRPVPYFTRDDAYATSGFGSFAELEDAVIEFGVPGGTEAKAVREGST